MTGGELKVAWQAYHVHEQAVMRMGSTGHCSEGCPCCGPGPRAEEVLEEAIGVAPGRATEAQWQEVADLLAANN